MAGKPSRVSFLLRLAAGGAAAAKLLSRGEGDGNAFISSGDGRSGLPARIPSLD